MAISNMANEPRREIIEQIVGSALVVGAISIFAVADHWLAYQVLTIEDTADKWFSHILAGFILFFAAMVAVAIINIAHWAGEAACDQLDRAGLRLRPLER